MVMKQEMVSRKNEDGEERMETDGESERTRTPGGASDDRHYSQRQRPLATVSDH
jgi:hypothetical protein